MRIVLFHRGFDLGGAERQMALTALTMKKRGHHVEIVVLHDGDAFRTELENGGIRPRVVPSVPRWKLPLQIRRRLLECRPDVVLAALAGPNILSLLSKVGPQRPRVVWGVRSTSLDLSQERRVGRYVYRAEPAFSRWSDATISNSSAGKGDAIRRGFRPAQFFVVPNGIEVPAEAAPGRRSAARSRLGYAENDTVVGFVGRLHPVKDLPLLLHAFGSITDDQALLAIVGSGPVDYLEELKAMSEKLGVEGRVRWIDEVSRPQDLYPAFDLTVSASQLEGFSNVLGESMAAGVPCVATHVGDSADLIADTGLVVPAGDVEAMAAALDRVIEMGPAARQALGTAARQRIIDHFSVDMLGIRLERTLARILEDERR
jgi:glycosyltransferase involved in cell wall biosynthesis